MKTKLLTFIAEKLINLAFWIDEPSSYEHSQHRVWLIDQKDDFASSMLDAQLSQAIDVLKKSIEAEA